MKRKLFLLAVALLYTVGMWAQTDVTSKYLTNASFETGDMTGWTAFGANEQDTPVPTAALVSATALANAEGSYVCNYQWWCWSADGSSPNGISQTISSLPAGTYTLTAVVGAPLSSTYKQDDVERSCTWTVTLYANNESASTTTMSTDYDGQELSVTFTLAEDAAVTVKAILTASVNIWQECIMRLDNFKLYRQTDMTGTWIVNAGFEACTAATSDVNTSDTGQGTDYTANGWTRTQTSAWCNAAAIEYGGSVKLNGVSVIATDNAGATGKSLGVTAGWSGTIKYQSANAVTLPAGHYELSVYAYNGGEAAAFNSQFGFVLTSGAEYISTATSYALNTWVKDVVAFDLDAATEGKFQIGVIAEEGGSGNTGKVFFDNMALSYSPFADASDYAALETAITKVEAYTLGFDAGEYAPYGFAHSLTKAKAIDSNANNPQATVRELIDALNAVTANVGEVDAVYNGSYATVTEGANYPDGWARINAWGQMRTDAGEYVTAYYNQPGSLKYGDTGRFTMPLKADTYYKLTFAYRAHENNSNNGMKASVLCNGEGLAETSFDANGSTSVWKVATQLFLTGAAGNYVLTLANSGNTWLTGVSIVRATAAEVKEYLLLQPEITKANAAYNGGANVGTGVFQVPQSAGDAFSAAITAAQGVYDNASATVAEVRTALNNLVTAEETFANATLNAPTSGKRYYLKVATSGHAKVNNAVVVSMGETTDNNKTGYGFTAAAEPAAYLAQAFIFEQKEDNDYYISVERPEGTVYLTYGSLNNSAASWATQQIQGTTSASAENHGVFRIVGTNAASTVKLFNTVHNDYIACENGGSLYTQGTPTLFSVVEAAEASVTVSAKAGKYGTVIFPFTPDVSEGFDNVKFYSIDSVNAATSNVQITEVDAPAANTPYLIKNNGESNFSKTLTGYGTAAADHYDAGLLTGVYTATTIAASVEPTADAAGAYRYVLQTPASGENEGVQAFYKVASDFTATANKCFLTVPVEKTDNGEVKAFYINLGGEDGIRALDNEPEMQDGGAVYNLAGQRVQQARKGLYIVRGKAVIVK